MKKITREWVDKAEADYATAQRELGVQNNPNYDAVCFHSQQCAEKFLKALLQEKGIRFIKTHDLTILLDSAVSVEPGLEILRFALHPMTAFAVEYRYPSESASHEEAREALEACDKVRRMIGEALTV